MDNIIDLDLADQLRVLYRQLRDAAEAASQALGNDHPRTLDEADLERFILADHQVARFVRKIIALRD